MPATRNSDLATRPGPQSRAAGGPAAPAARPPRRGLDATNPHLPVELMEQILTRAATLPAPPPADGPLLLGVRASPSFEPLPDP